MEKKNNYVEVKIEKRFLWMINCPDAFNKGNDIETNEEMTRLYWAIFTESEYEQFISNNSLEESKCGNCFSLWKDVERLGTAIKNL